MSTTARFTLRGRNPDVLSCIANLSNDEVFTPPELANRMLDTLAETWAASHAGASIWADPTVTFLDPCTKSGVFLREITRRLIDGLASHIPDLQTRVDHILTTQVYGIAITRITSLLARRSLYCSKYANGTHSIVKTFASAAGNIWYERLQHTWGDTKCVHCGAPKVILDRDESLENYAYAFIHADNIKTHIGRMFGGKMQFDIIIGNPPYQMKGGAGGTSDSSIYHLFVEQAIKLDPKYLSMVIPSRWLAGGRGLDDFRKEMLTGGHIQALVDFPDSGDAFPGVQIKGGVCYFLWNGSYTGTCEVTRIANGHEHLQLNRDLGEFDVFVRDERALSILKKVRSKNESSILPLISGDTPFGIATNFQDWSKSPTENSIPLHLIERGKRAIGYINRELIQKNVVAIDSWKVLVPEAYGAGESVPHQILGKLIVAQPPSVCTQSFLIISPLNSEQEASSVSSYYQTRFFRFLVSLRKITQHALRSTYTWVPMQTWDRTWTDEMLYEKYGITADEQAFIESQIKEMKLAGGDDD